MSKFDLTGKIAVVTGSTKGIGRGVVSTLVEQGARVIVSGRQEESGRQVAAELNARHGEDSAQGVAFDLNDRASIESYASRVAAVWGGVDILVCNAAILPYIGSSAATPPDLFDRILVGNVHHNFRLCQALRPEIARRGGGAITLIGSESGLTSSPLVLAYAAAKAAVAHMARCLADEFADDRIRVNCVAPGLVRSASSTETLGEAGLAAIARAQPLGRIGEPSDIAGAVAYLSSEAGSHVTGEVILVDGGRGRLSPRANSYSLSAVDGKTYA